MLAIPSRLSRMHLQEATLASKTRTLVAMEELERLVPVLKVGTLQLGPAVKDTSHPIAASSASAAWQLLREPAQMGTVQHHWYGCA